MLILSGFLVVATSVDPSCMGQLAFVYPRQSGTCLSRLSTGVRHVDSSRKCCLGTQCSSRKFLRFSRRLFQFQYLDHALSSEYLSWTLRIAHMLCYYFLWFSHPFPAGDHYFASRHCWYRRIVCLVCYQTPSFFPGSNLDDDVSSWSTLEETRSPTSCSPLK